MRRTVLSLLTALALVFSLATPAAAAPSVRCGTAGAGTTYGWVTSPIGGQKVGARHCRTMTPASLSGHWAYWFKTSSNVWVPTSNNAPSYGGPAGSSGRAHADAAEALAAKYGMRLHYVTYSGNTDRVGYVRSNGAVKVTGTYYPSPQAPGRGLIEISAGGGNLGAADKARGKSFMRTFFLNNARHEIAHGEIEQRCGTWNPPIVGSRAENVTDAYAITFLGKTTTSYGYTRSDVTKARAIKAGNCG